VTDLVPYQPSETDVALPESPSALWRIVKAEPVSVAGRSHRNDKRMLNLVLEHEKASGEIVTVEVYVDATWKLSELRPFLDAAQDLPDGIRIKLYVAEKVWWDRRPGRHP
jgi:hypothetical protein